jgi:hypothetical protein
VTDKQATLNVCCGVVQLSEHMGCVVAEAFAAGEDVLLKDDFQVAGGFQVEDSFNADTSTLCRDILFEDTFWFDCLWVADGF